MVALSTTTDITAPAAPGSSASWWAENPAKAAAAEKAAAKAEKRRSRVRVPAPATLASAAPTGPSTGSVAALVPAQRRHADRIARAILGADHPVVVATPEPPAASSGPGRRAGAVRSVAKKVSGPGQRFATELGTQTSETAAAIGILRRDGEWALRDRARRITPDKRVADCSRTPHGGAVSVHAGHLSGLMMCDSVWSCAVCAPSIRNERAKDLDRKARAWTKAGGTLVMVTTTIRHKRGDRLAPQMKRVARAWQKMLSGRFRTSFYEAFNVAGITRVIETTHGKNSWHTHIHALVWLRADDVRATGDELAEQLRAALFGKWAGRVGKEGLGVPNAKHGVHVKVMKPGPDGAADLAQYISKWSVGMELSREDRKKGGRNRHKTRTPFQILDDATDPATREPQRVVDSALWAEYVRAAKGHQFMTWSGTIREELAELPAEEEESEEEPLVDPVASVMAGPWRKVVRRVAGRPLALVKAAESGGRDAVFELCHSWGLVIGVDVFVPEPSSEAEDGQMAVELTRQAVQDWESRRPGVPGQGVKSAQILPEVSADPDNPASAGEAWLERAARSGMHRPRIDAAAFARIYSLGEDLRP